MTTSASLCKGPIFYYYPLPYARVMVIFTFPFSFYPLESTMCWKDPDIYGKLDVGFHELLLMTLPLR